MANCCWPQENESLNHSLNEDVAYSVPSWLTNCDATTAATLKCPYYPPDVSGSRSHSESEKRRRDRINAQFATLRKLLPKSEKMDKAALLGHVVEHVKELSTKAKEVTKFTTIPSETDEIAIDYFNQEKSTSQENGTFYIKALVCCTDRPELLAELNSVFDGLGFTIAQADLTSLGGRITSSFVLRSTDDNVAKRHFCMNSLKKSLNLVLNRNAISSNMSNYSVRSKRQRFFYLDSN